MRNSSLICTGSTLLPQVEACFQFILLPNRFKTRAYFGGSNNGPKQSKRVTKRLSFITICCEKSPFYVLLNNFIVWISDKEAFRIIQSHHVIKHAVFKQSKGFFWLRVVENTAAYCIIFLTFWNTWLRQQISKIPSLYKVLLNFCWNDEGKQAVETKAECFKAWRLFLFSSLFLSNMHYWPSVRSVYGQIPFFAFC